MRKYFKAEFFDEGAEAIERIAAITRREPGEVVCDAFMTYLWVLHQQTFGAKVASRAENYEDPLPEDLVKEPEEARKYFEDLGW